MASNSTYTFSKQSHGATHVFVFRNNGETVTWEAFRMKQQPDFENTGVEPQDAYLLIENLSSDSPLRSDGFQRTGYTVYIPHTSNDRMFIQVPLAKLQTVSVSGILNHQKAHVTEVGLRITQMPLTSFRSSSILLTGNRGLGSNS